MSYLLAAQDAVTWQHRGVITSSVQFFRTIGGAVGIGLLGALFNMLVRPEMQQLQSQGITPADILTPSRRAKIPEATMRAAHHAIGHGLLYVFAAMLLCAMLMLVVSTMMSRHRADDGEETVGVRAMEAMAG